MAERALYLDASPGERRGVVAIDGRPERLLIERSGQGGGPGLGAVLAARVVAVATAARMAFLQLPGGAEGVLNLGSEGSRPAEGAWLEVEVRGEARRGKSAVLRALGPAEAPVRLLRPPPDLEARLAEFAPRSQLHVGAGARAMADLAQDEALAIEFPLHGGARMFVEPTRSLCAIDIDLAATAGEAPKRATRAANLAAVGEAARVLRLKGLGGLVVIDLVGRGHDAAAILAAARSAFAPDNPGVVIGQVSRLGLLEISLPRRLRPTIEVLAGEDGRPTAATLACALLRAIEREARADPGGRFVGLAAPAVAEAAAAHLPQLVSRLGARVSLRPEPGRSPSIFEVARS